MENLKDFVSIGVVVASSLGCAIGTLVGTIFWMNRQFNELKLKFVGLEKNIDLKFASLEKDIDSRFNKVDLKFASLEKDIDSKFNKVDLKFASLEKDIAVIKTVLTIKNITPIEHAANDE
jgi:hypothetical protein